MQKDIENLNWQMVWLIKKRDKKVEYKKQQKEKDRENKEKEKKEAKK